MGQGASRWGSRGSSSNILLRHFTPPQNGPFLLKLTQTSLVT